MRCTALVRGGRFVRFGCAFLAVMVLVASTFMVGTALAIPDGPTVTEAGVENVGPTIVTLHAKVTPGEADTAYRFEYGSTTAYGRVIPLHDEDIGRGTEAIRVSQSVEGLSADTIYHYRVVATNSKGSTSSEDETFSTFGVQHFEASILNSDGSSDQQAGSHPYAVSASFTLPINTESNGEPVPAGSPKDVTIELPSGLIGDPNSVPRCPYSVLAESHLGLDNCPSDTQVGLLTLDISSSIVVLPVYNLIPPKGGAAQFGAFALFLPVTMDATVRTGGDYGTNITLKNLSQLPPIKKTSLTLWGIPADPHHNLERGNCISLEGVSSGECPSEALPTSFITLPTSCNSPLTFGIQADAWAQPGEFVSSGTMVETSGEALKLTGCERLSFEPSISVTPNEATADAPFGATINVAEPQNSSGSLAPASLKEASVVLPEGMSVNPAAGDGLGSCTAAEFSLGSADRPSCPDSANIGSAEVETPLAPIPLTGAIYLAQPNNNPFDSLLAAYVVAEGDGVILKLPLELAADMITGQITVRLSAIPQIPFSDLKLSLHGGPRAVLASPDSCGSFTTTTQLTPFSAPDSGPPLTLVSSLAVDAGCDGGLDPSFIAGGNNAGADEGTSFMLQMTRGDGQQHFGSLTAELPPGLIANLQGVQECDSTLAALGTCDAASRVGTAAIAIGAGSHPFFLSGAIFLTGPYRGAPFGLSIVLPGIVGPFNLGSVVLRAKVSLGPGDLHLVIASDPLPQIIDGIPLRLKTVNLMINRPGFFINPTDCAHHEIHGVVDSVEGASAALYAPFQVRGCSLLPFAPRLSASMTGRNKTGIQIKVAMPAVHGANMRSLAISIYGPVRPRLTAIQNACRAATFIADPAMCPRGAVVGHASVTTPTLGTSLGGSIYLVAHGGVASHPDLMMVLQGKGISVELDGTVQISAGGTIKTIFQGLPDVPLRAFTLELAHGSNSILGLIGNPCSKQLHIGYVAEGHNGSLRKGLNKVAVKGCGAPKSSMGAGER